ncbi:MAG: hypothetical protein M3N29_11305 [Chloroflexota bacterium]|nr:hypothetical protein [Chloroflexota bacterium]
MDDQTTLSLTTDERDVLRDVLDRDFRDLKQEIGSTEDWEYKEALKARRSLLEAILRKLGAEL